MASLLSDRQQTPENQRLVKEAVQALFEAQGSGPTEKPATNTTLVAGAIAVFVLASGIAWATMAAGRRPARTVPYTEKAVINTEMMGTRGGVEAFLPSTPSGRGDSSLALPVGPPPATPAEMAALVDGTGGAAPAVPRDVPSPARRAGGAQAGELAIAAPAASVLSAGQCATCRPGEMEGAEVFFDETVATSDSTVPATVPAPPLVNVGSRLPVRLTDTVVTGSAATPVLIEVAADFLRGGRVLVPKGAHVVGEAYSSHASDRALIAVTALVIDGRTVPVRAIVLGADRQLGLPGRLVRKASRARGGVGRVVRAVGSAVTFGVLGGTSDYGLVGAAAGEMVQSAGEDLARTGQRWVVSDKVLNVSAGTLGELYVQSDLVLQ